MQPTFFPSAEAFRKWLTRHHASASELWIGFWKVDSGRSGMTYKEAVDEALCFGWIDGIRKKVDEASYTNRFTPRKPRSNWSQINIRRIAELQAEGRMHPAGMKVFEERVVSTPYSFESAPATLSPELEKQFRANKKAWTYFEAQPPGYRRVILHWVMSAKKEETRVARLDKLIATSARGERIT
ncbi:MAG TPA: YdeI/OmpD-associated family protein [Thermoanaerobaculia bacterium]|jgi:uncharacterized protein YdeI (YjbR/CyaY-like superfamily)